MGMEAPRTSSAQANQLELERIGQEQTSRIRSIKKEQQEEVDKLITLHKRDMENLDNAFQLELTTNKNKHDTALNDLYTSQATQIAKIENDGKVNVAQLQENFRAQTAEIQASGDRNLRSMHELYERAQENLKAQKGNA